MVVRNICSEEEVCPSSPRFDKHVRGYLRTTISKVEESPSLARKYAQLFFSEGVINGNQTVKVEEILDVLNQRSILMISPVLRFSDIIGDDATIEKIGPPDKVISAFGPEMIGENVEGKVLSSNVAEHEGRAYY
ncbi:hypothetical protein MTR_6g018710 [Medicago truncatula]|uniref:Uncharacterized protein n=2 Tax=Medicago truncatula TaxID=3880 RepID=A0A072U7P9_MEDTR|nr:hypothetical protein MTR_6g018710 [Medicago truncatula]